MKITYNKLISFGVGIDETGKSQYIWVQTGREMDAMLILFDKGWKSADFVFENCEILTE